MTENHYDCAAHEIAQLMEEAREKDAEIERLKGIVTNLAETLKLWAEAYGHQADFELAKNALKEIS